MNTVVITGSSRGLGYEMAKCFHDRNWNVVINGVVPERLEKAAASLRACRGSGGVEWFLADVSNPKDVEKLADYAVSRFGSMDIWINNAGVNQPMKPVWELSEKEIEAVLNIDLKGTILGSAAAIRRMEKQPDGGYVYNMEGLGSSDQFILGFGLYGTSKRAVTYFTQALAKELQETKNPVKAGLLSPGIMITDFTQNALGSQPIDLPEKTKAIYNILGDYPDVVARFLVDKMLTNTSSNAHIVWLTNAKAAWRFMSAPFHKRDFFSDTKN